MPTAVRNKEPVPAPPFAEMDASMSAVFDQRVHVPLSARRPSTSHAPQSTHKNPVHAAQELDLAVLQLRAAALSRFDGKGAGAGLSLSQKGDKERRRAAASKLAVIDRSRQALVYSTLLPDLFDTSGAPRCADDTDALDLLLHTSLLPHATTNTRPRTASGPPPPPLQLQPHPPLPSALGGHTSPLPPRTARTPRSSSNGASPRHRPSFDGAGSSSGALSARLPLGEANNRFRTDRGRGSPRLRSQPAAAAAAAAPFEPIEVRPLDEAPPRRAAVAWVDGAAEPLPLTAAASEAVAAADAAAAAAPKPQGAAAPPGWALTGCDTTAAEGGSVGGGGGGGVGDDGGGGGGGDDGDGDGEDGSGGGGSGGGGSGGGGGGGSGDGDGGGGGGGGGDGDGDGGGGIGSGGGGGGSPKPTANRLGFGGGALGGGSHYRRRAPAWDPLRDKMRKGANQLSSMLAGQTTITMLARQAVHNKKVIAALRATPYFADLGEIQMQMLARSGKVRNLARYAVVYREGADAHAFYVLTSGAVQLSTSMPKQSVTDPSKTFDGQGKRFEVLPGEVGVCFGTDALSSLPRNVSQPPPTHPSHPLNSLAPHPTLALATTFTFSYTLARSRTRAPSPKSSPDPSP